MLVKRDIVVIGASAGGLLGLKVLLQGLPSLLSAAVFVVLHQPADAPHTLRAFLQNNSTLPVRYSKDGDPIVFGQVYLAVPGRHLLLDGERSRLTDDPKERYVRPAIDVLFRSAAATFESRVVGILLSGNLNDGTAGLMAIKAHGGIALVQSPEEAEWPSMPLSAIEHVAVDNVLRISEMPAEIVRLTR